MQKDKIVTRQDKEDTSSLITNIPAMPSVVGIKRRKIALIEIQTGNIIFHIK